MQNKKDTNTHVCIVLEVPASVMTQGGMGKGTEDRFAWMWPS